MGSYRVYRAWDEGADGSGRCTPPFLSPPNRSTAYHPPNRRPIRPFKRCAERCLPCRTRELKRRGRKPSNGPSTEDQPALEPPLLARQPLLDMVLKQANPKGDAELFLRCFHEVRVRVDVGKEGGSA